ESFSFRLDRTGKVDGPENDIVMMGAPVGHRATGVVVPIAEHGVATLWKVFHFGRLAQPEIPIEFLRHGQGLEWTFPQSRGKPNGGFLELSDTPIANQFASEAEARIAAL